MIGPPAGLAPALSAALRRRGRTVLHAGPSDAADDARAAWLLAEAGEPPLVLLCEQAPYPVAERLLGPGRRVVVADERRLAAVTANRRPARRPEARALSRAAHRLGGAAHAIALGRAGRRWTELGGRARSLSAESAAALVVRTYAASAAG